MDGAINFVSCERDRVLREVLEIKEMMKAMSRQTASSIFPPKRTAYKNSDAAKERALQIGRNMLITSSSAEGVPSVRELAKAMGVSTASLYKKKTGKNKDKDNPYHSIIIHREMMLHSYSVYSSSTSLRKGIINASDDGSVEVDGVHYDEEIED